MRGSRWERRPGLQDRMWRGNQSWAALDGLAMPTVADVRAAVLEIARCGPGARIGLVRSRDNWVYDPARLAELVTRMVVDIRPSAGEGLAEDLLRFHRLGGLATDSELSLQLGVGPDQVFIGNDHQIADGQTAAYLVLGVLDCARRGVLPEWAVRPSVSWPLTRALARTFSDPRRVRGVLAARRAARGSSVPAPGQPAGRGGAAALPTPEELRPALVLADTTAAERARARKWCDEYSRGATDALVALVAVREALRRVGLPQSPQVTLVVDLRRYLDRGALLHQNFVSGLQLPVPAAADPAEVGQQAAAILSSGRPLAAYAMSLAKTWRAELATSARGSDPRVGSPDDPVPLTHVYLGHRAGGDEWPWRPEAPRRMVAWTNPDGPRGVTALVGTVGRGWQFNLCHYAGWIDPGLLRQAGELLARPAELLASARRQRAAGPRGVFSR